jgi:hypothetical protein
MIEGIIKSKNWKVDGLCDLNFPVAASMEDWQIAESCCSNPSPVSSRYFFLAAAM